MFKIFFFFLMLFSASSFADTYQDAAGTSQMLADSIADAWSYIFDDVPTMWDRFFAWLVVWYVKAKLYAYLALIKFSWQVGQVIIADLNIMSQVTANIALLPADVRQAFIDMRLFDGINILFGSFMTKFVMRTIM